MVGPSSEGMRPVAKYFQDPQSERMKNLKWGFINADGRVITRPAAAPASVKGILAFDAVGPFSGGYAPVMWRVWYKPNGVDYTLLPPRASREEKGFIDKSGKFFRSRPAVKSERPSAPSHPVIPSRESLLATAKAYMASWEQARGAKVSRIVAVDITPHNDAVFPWHGAVNADTSVGNITFNFYFEGSKSWITEAQMHDKGH